MDCGIITAITATLVPEIIESTTSSSSSATLPVKLEIVVGDPSSDIEELATLRQQSRQQGKKRDKVSKAEEAKKQRMKYSQRSLLHNFGGSNTVRLGIADLGD